MARTAEATRLKESVKEAIVELMQEEPALFQEMIVEALEDMALLRAMTEGRKTKLVPREKLSDLLKGKK